jgi:hypothetical protein
VNAPSTIHNLYRAHHRYTPGMACCNLFVCIVIASNSATVGTPREKPITLFLMYLKRPTAGPPVNAPSTIHNLHREAHHRYTPGKARRNLFVCIVIAPKSATIGTPRERPITLFLMYLKKPTGGPPSERPIDNSQFISSPP